MAGGLVLIFLAVVAFGSATIGDILASKGRPHPRPRGILRRMFLVWTPTERRANARIMRWVGAVELVLGVIWLLFDVIGHFR